MALPLFLGFALLALGSAHIQPDQKQDEPVGDLENGLGGVEVDKNSGRAQVKKQNESSYVLFSSTVLYKAVLRAP